ncbi:MAG: DUF4124 domain-containing protein [Burkholderiales bacterium]|nr:DUF4124 domain-containing protein [Burkholderiales bacterium]
MPRTTPLKSSVFAIKLSYLLLISMSISDAAFATIYQCQQNGKNSYSQTPCPQDALQVTREPEQLAAPVSSEAQLHAQQQLEKEKKEVKRLETDRHRLEARRDREIQKIANHAEKQKQQCSNMHLRVKWAQEDLANAAPRAESKARQKLKRAAEKAALVCDAR